MQNKDDAANQLGVKPVGELLLKFSIPAVSGMLVNALYNAVDRVFVGRGVNEDALGGLSLIMPLITISMAFAMLFGVGSANMISMRLGQRKKAEAENALNHGFWLLLASSVFISVFEYIFLDDLLPLLGAREGSRVIESARDYFKIIIYGQPFFLVGFGLSHSTRAQGFPVISMIGMFLGAVLNTLLDPLFIFAFGWGVKGAALATIISQAASAIWMLYFNLGNRAVINLRPFKVSFSKEIVFSILGFGSSQFLLQFMMSAVQLLLNTSMGWYGAKTLGAANGGDSALSGMNIIGTFTMLFFMPVFGINQGAQPILGYNYGAGKFNRVRKAYLYAAAVSTCICAVGFIWAQFFPQTVVRIFAPDGSETLYQVTVTGMRIASLVLPLNGFQIVSTNMFVVTGRPKISILLSLMRQCIVIIPAILIFGRIWGLYGVVAAIPFADAITFTVTFILIIRELKKLKD
ncbi:MAG: MATE family efflux transporter [Spirochaetaceae bacterium]|jgi:putative MATE family efflux protein|nr:MATE family efflux transporter [Spirochaetaceae bacterium]